MSYRKNNNKKADDECGKDNYNGKTEDSKYGSNKSDNETTTSKSGKSRNRNGSKGRSGRPKTESRGSGSTGGTERNSLNRSHNSADWSKPDPVAMDQATGFSFANYIGAPVSFNFSGETWANSPKPQALHIGAISVMEINPSVGKVGVGAAAKMSAINQQGFKLYSRLSSVNSKNTLYGPQDVTTLMLAVGELISMVSWVQRTFGLTWTYNVRNRNMPKYLIHAAGFDPDDFFHGLAQYRITLNTLLVQANKIPFPSNFNYFMKCAQLYSSVYKDSPDDMAQLYVFRPYSTWYMDETDPNGTKLVTHKIPYDTSNDIGMAKMSDVLSIIESMINTLLTSATYNYIYSDILNFASRNYGNTSVQMLNFGTLPEEYSIVPVYEESVLSQIHNANIMGVPVATSGVVTVPYPHLPNTPSNDVIPNETTLCLEYNPCWIRQTQFQVMDRLLNFHEMNPDTDARIEATRLVSGATNSYPQTGGTFADIGIISSDHYVVDMTVLTDGSLDNQWKILSSNVAENGYNGFWFTGLHFKNFPIMYNLSKYVDADHPSALSGIWCELDTYTTIEMTTLLRINDLGMYGMFEPKDFQFSGIVKK